MLRMTREIRDMPCQLIDLLYEVSVALALEALDTTVEVTAIVIIAVCRCLFAFKGRCLHDRTVLMQDVMARARMESFIVEACAGDECICGRYRQTCKGV